MFYNHFTTEQLLPLYVSIIFLVSSLALFYKNERVSLLLLVCGSVGLGVFVALLDPFLNLWDEQYHALVAKHLSINPLTPKLYSNPALEYDYRHWTGNEIWLHKQPLFLWQMALSIKLFGTTELAVRLPSILMHGILPLFIFRIGKLVVNKRVGYYGALLFSVAYFPLELIVGRYSTDHNDVAFLFYITASFWAWFEYSESKKTRWLVLIGVLSGAAVLVKWLMGLLVFVIWFLVASFSSRTASAWLRSYWNILKSGLVSLLVFIPWQVYIHLTFPKEAAYETGLNSRHFFEVIEDHGEPFWFHFEAAFRKIYGSGFLMPFLVILGVLFLVKSTQRNQHKLLISFTLAFIYVFYTLAATKMVAFTLIASPFIFLGFGCMCSWITDCLENNIKTRVISRLLSVLIIAVISVAMLNLNKLENYHTDWKPNDNFDRSKELFDIEFIKSLEKQLKDGQYVIFNAHITVNSHIPIMFYTDHVAYDVLPTQIQIDNLKAKGYSIAVVDTEELPSYLRSDESIVKLSTDFFIKSN